MHRAVAKQEKRTLFAAKVIVFHSAQPLYITTDYMITKKCYPYMGVRSSNAMPRKLNRLRLKKYTFPRTTIDMINCRLVPRTKIVVCFLTKILLLFSQSADEARQIA